MNQPHSSIHAPSGAFSRTVRWVLALWAVLNIGVAIDIGVFWHRFYSGALFDKAELAKLIPHFEGYYAWESSFTTPDLVLALVLLISAVLVLRQPLCSLGRFGMSVCTGALFFLGGLDLNYGLRSGIYQIDHPFAMELLFTGVGLPLLSILNVSVLYYLLRVSKSLGLHS